MKSPPRPAEERIEQSRAFAIEAARLAANTRATNVVVLDVSHLSPVADFFVIGTGTSARQMRTVCDDIAELGEERGYPAHSTSGYEGQSWMLLDCIDVVFHLFSQDARMFYDLEGLWGDAKKVEWKEEPQMNTDKHR